MTLVSIIAEHPLSARYLSHVLERQGADFQTNTMDFASGLMLSPPDHLKAVCVIESPAWPRLSAYIGPSGSHPPLATAIAVTNPANSDSVCHLLAAGFKGFVSYDEVDEYLVRAIQSVGNDKLWVTRDVMERYLANQGTGQVSRRYMSTHLTPREALIAGLVAKARSNKEIAHELGISERTVKFHVSNIFQKIGVTCRASLCANWVPPRGASGL
jgi:DNA-binding NarL/FixJ family response regulator